MRVTPLWRVGFRFSRPGKLICVGPNCRDHAQDGAAEPPAAPLLFSKSQTTVEDGEAIRLPACSKHVDAEAELGVVIGSVASDVDTRDALDNIAGYTIAKDSAHATCRSPIDSGVTA